MKKLLIILFLGLSIVSNGQLMIPGVVASSGTANPAASTLLNGLIAGYKLDDSGSTLVDVLGNANGTGTGLVQEGTTKVLGYSQAFSGAGDKMEVANETYLLPAGNEFTLSMWFRQNSLPSVNGQYHVLFLLVRGSDPWETMNIYIPPGGQPDYIVAYILNQAGTVYETQSNATVGINTWYHFVFTVKNGENIAMYLNGTLINNVNTEVFSGTGFLTGTDVARIGEDLDGYLDEVYVYRRYFPEASVDSLYNVGSGKTYPFN